MNSHARTGTGPADDFLSRLIDDITRMHETLMRALARLVGVAAASPCPERVPVAAVADHRAYPGSR
jgi:hypothetical protein